MKVFAILTAALMTAGGAAYYFSASDSSAPCCKLKSAPVAKTGGCCTDEPTCGLCPTSTAKTDCCAIGAECCVAGAACCLSPVAAKVEAEEECCAHCVTPAKVAANAALAGVSLK